MGKIVHFAVVYVFRDGEFQVSIPCRNEEEVMEKVSRYGEKIGEKVRVVCEGLPPFWIQLKKEERAKYARPVTAHRYAREFTHRVPKELKLGEPAVKDHSTTPISHHSDIFYDPWTGHTGRVY